MNKEDLKLAYLERFSFLTVDEKMNDYSAWKQVYKEFRPEMEKEYSSTEQRLMLQEWKKEIV